MLPSFDNIWRGLVQKYPNLLREAQDNPEQFEEYIDFEQLALEENLLMPEDIELYEDRKELSGSERREIIELYGDAINEIELRWNRDPYVPMEALRDYYEDLYDDLEKGLRGVSGSDIWRSITLSKNVDPRDLETLGIYWSRYREGAQSYWDWSGPKGDSQEIVYHAAAPKLDQVDIEGTVEANFIPEFGAEERELRLKDGARLFVYSAELPNGEIVEINDWRAA